MRTTATPTMLTTSERVYQLLLWLYPSDYRREYGADMMQLFRDLRRDPPPAPRPRAPPVPPPVLAASAPAAPAAG